MNEHQLGPMEVTLLPLHSCHNIKYFCSCSLDVKGTGYLNDFNYYFEAALVLISNYRSTRIPN